jgi:hypothetical protein
MRPQQELQVRKLHMFCRQDTALLTAVHTYRCTHQWCIFSAGRILPSLQQYIHTDVHIDAVYVLQAGYCPPYSSTYIQMYTSMLYMFCRQDTSLLTAVHTYRCTHQCCIFSAGRILPSLQQYIHTDVHISAVYVLQAGYCPPYNIKYIQMDFPSL